MGIRQNWRDGRESRQAWKTREKAETSWWIPSEGHYAGSGAGPAHEYANPAECLADLRRGIDLRDQEEYDHYVGRFFEPKIDGVQVKAGHIMPERLDNTGAALKWMGRT